MKYWMIGVPTYDGKVDMSTAQAVRAAVEPGPTPVPVRSIYSRSSLLPSAFNELLCAAINDDDCEWFAMLHADVEPETHWLSKMVALSERLTIDVLSAVLPMRDDTGLTSTAVDMPQSRWGRHKQQRRLSIRETRALPNTFAISDVCASLGIDPTYRYEIDPPDCARSRALLINTGLMLLRMSKIRESAKASGFQGFQLASRLVINPDGSVGHVVEPEDWRFSRWACRAGLWVAATHEIRANHHGADAIRPNHCDWGLWARDEDWFKAQADNVSVEQSATMP